MKIEKVYPNGIVVPHRLRAVVGSKVKQIAQSMREIGLQQPITVWEPREGECELVAGAHRLQAAVDLGWEWIDCIFKEDWSDIDRQLWEIDENLMRAELTPTQMAVHLAKRKELWRAREVSVQVASKPQGGRPAGFASETAEKTGINKSTVTRAIARADAIPEPVRDQILGTHLDKGVYLDSLKGMDEAAQLAKVRADLRAPPKPKIISVVDADEKQAAAIMREWNRASSEARRIFLRRLEDQEPPVFDRASA